MAAVGDKLMKEFKNELPRMNSEQLHTYRVRWIILFFFLISHAIFITWAFFQRYKQRML